MRFFLFILFVFLPIITFSQQYSIVSHINLHLNNDYANGKNMHFPFLSLGIDKKKNQKTNFRIELAKLQFNKENEINDNIFKLTGDKNKSIQKVISNTNINLRFQQLKIIKEYNKLNIYYSIAALINYNYYREIPQIISFFPIKINSLNISSEIGLGLKYKINKMFFIDIQALSNIAQLGVRNSVYENPSILIEQQRIKVLNFEFLPYNHYLRVGIIKTFKNRKSNSNK